MLSMLIMLDTDPPFFFPNLQADKIIPVIMANGVPGGPQLLARSIAAASFQDSEDPDDPKWVVNMARHHAGKNINGDMMVSFAVASVLYDYETGKEIFPVVSDDESDAHILDDHPLVTVINLSPEVGVGD